MTNPLTLIGNQYAMGTAVDNTGTDVFTIYNGNNTITTGNNASNSAGNLDVFGNPFGNLGMSPPLGEDGATTLNIGNSSAVVDQITLDLSYNLIQSSASTSFAASDVNVMLDPNYGWANPNVFQGHNTVNLVASISTIDVGDNAYAPSGHNTATVANAGGVTDVVLTGAQDAVTLTGDVQDTVVTGANSGGTGGFATVNVGFFDDNAFGNTSHIQIAGVFNIVNVGDANNTIGGGTWFNRVNVGDGTDSVNLSGMFNSVTVGGGNDTVNIGGGYASVSILGVDHNASPSFSPDPWDGPVPASPTDLVLLAGIQNTVFATYENVNVSGSQGLSLFNLGNGNNNVTAGGNGNIVNVGNGVNVVLLNGNSNSVMVTDPTGSGSDTINLGGGSGDTIGLDHAAGSVIGTGTGTTTVTQAANATNPVLVNLNNGIGIISLGNGVNIVRANGNGSSITVGDGGNNIYAMGSGDTITAGNGDDVINTGNNASVTAGNGNDNVTAGNFATVLVGNGQDTIHVGSNGNVTAGSGNDSIHAGNNSSVTASDGYGASDTVWTGTNSTVALGNGNDIVSVGGGSSVTVGNGNDQITGYSPGGNITVGGGNGNDVVTLAGINNSVMLGNGNDTVSSTGSGASVTVGTGNDSVTTGANSFVSANAANGAPPPTDTISVGANSTVLAGGGTQLISGTSSDSFFLNNLLNPSQISVTGSGNLVALGNGNDTADVTLNASQTGNTVVVQSDTSNNYSGTVTLNNFGQNSQIDLQGLVGANHAALTSWAAVSANLTSAAGNYTLALQGGGAVNFVNQGALNPGQFGYTPNTGMV